MATEIYHTEDITLLDSKEVELRPLAVAKLRKVMRLWSEHMALMQKHLVDGVEEGETQLTEADLTDKQFDVYIKMCALALETELKEDKTDKQFMSYLEDTLDEATIYRVLDVCAGLKLGNQNPAETAN